MFVPIKVYGLCTKLYKRFYSTYNNEEHSFTKWTKILVQENIELKEKIQDLEGQILNLNQGKNTKTTNLANQNQEEENSYGLQTYENKSLEVYQQEEIPLKTKKGIFGTKFVEDKSSKK